jgi:hypothetical protein
MAESFEIDMGTGGTWIATEEVGGMPPLHYLRVVPAPHWFTELAKLAPSEGRCPCCGRPFDLQPPQHPDDDRHPDDAPAE